MPRQTIQDECEDILNRIERFGARVRSATGTTPDAVMHRRELSFVLNFLGPQLKTMFGIVVSMAPGELKEEEI